MFAGLVLIGVIIWPLTDLIAAHDVGQIAGAQRATALQTAREAVRTQVLTLGAGLAAFAALVYTARNYALSRESQVTDRYTKAIEQLGSKELDIRIGGIYALERIARDSARDHPVVMEVLQTFVREHSPTPFARASEAEQSAGGVGHLQADIQAAVTVIGRRNFSYDRGALGLYGSDLSGLILTDADLAGADLTSSKLESAYLSGTTFLDTWLPNANLIQARLDRCDLRGAWMSRANLTDASMHQADLTHALLDEAILVRADLTGATLAHGVNLDGADLTDARWPPYAIPPQGWYWDPSSGRLTRTPVSNPDTTDHSSHAPPSGARLVRPLRSIRQPCPDCAPRPKGYGSGAHHHM